MTKVNFIETYLDGVSPAYHTKSWKTIVKLERDGELTIFDYCMSIIQDLKITELTGVKINTIKGYKKRESARLMYLSLKKDAAKLMVKEFEK